MRLFVTGGTGGVGVEVLRLLLQDASHPDVRVLVRAATPAALECRWRALLQAASDGRVAPDACPWLRPVAGDVTQEGLGLDGATRRWIAHEVTHVLHAAAITDFNAALDDVVPVNVDGTARVLGLARGARRLEAVAHVSTLYVGGRRTGLVRETDLEHDAGFVNAYEASKYDAERRVRDAMRELPIAVYRLSLLLGRATDGYVYHPLEAHKMFELFLSGRATRIPGHPAHTLDMLPSDHAASILVRLFREHFAAGRTYQISCGDHAPTGADLIEACRRHLRLDRWSVDWMDAGAWAAARRAADEGEGDLSPAAAWMFDVVSDYLLRPKTFARDAVMEALGASTPPVPALVDYLPRILARCAATNWGRAQTAVTA